MNDRPLKKVLASWYASDDELRAIRDAVGDGVEIVGPEGRPTLSRYECSLRSIQPHLCDADAIIGWVIPEGSLEQAASLRLISWLHAGIDELDLAELARRGVRVCNIRGANAIAVAEHAMALLLAIAKRVPMKHAAMREGRALAVWEPHTRGASLHGRTVAIIGLGEIGQRIAQRLAGFEMRVIAVRSDPSKDAKHVDAVHGPDALIDVIREADFVILALPITAHTEGLIGREQLAACKPGAFLINIARGNIIDESALAQALSDGRLGGYASDVWWNYTNSFPATYHFPVPSRTGIQHLESVVGSGDQGSNAEGVLQRVIEFGTRSLAEFQAGAPLSLEVGLARGY